MRVPTSAMDMVGKSEARDGRWKTMLWAISTMSATTDEAVGSEPAPRLSQPEVRGVDCASTNETPTGVGMKKRIAAGCLLIVLQAVLARAEETAAPASSWSDRLRIGGLFYLTYQDGTVADEDLSRFYLTRAYLTAEAEVLPFMSARITFDTAQDLEGQGYGDMEVRLKYAFAKFRFADRWLLSSPNLEAGIVHMVWLDFEESINLYRLRGPMFMERSNLFNSADFGLTFASGLGPKLGANELSYAGNKYDARHGSLALGLYNGTGYHGDERNVDKVAEARVTWRPIPDLAPGLQVSGLLIDGKGNLPADGGGPPDWEVANLFVSYQFRRGTATAQVVDGVGNQDGSWIEAGDPSDAMPYSGYSAFLEWRLGGRQQWRLNGSFDRLERVAEDGSDFSFRYAYAAIGFDLGKENILLLDVDRRDWDAPARATDTRVQLVLQVSF